MKQKKIRRRYVLLAILAALVVLAAVLAHWQRNNIQAVKDFTTYTQEELEEQLQQNDQTIKETVNAAPEITVRDVTEEEKQALRDGTMTREELANRLLTTPSQEAVQPVPEDQSTQNVPAEEKPVVEQPAVSQPQPQKPDVSKPAVSQPAVQEPAVTPEQSAYEQKLSELVAEVYVLREDYMIALDNLQAEAIAAYKAIPSEQRSGSKLADFVSSFLAKGTSLEKDCDKKMDAIVKEMEQLIKANKGDLSLIDTVISTYANEKSLKKAWYMSELEKRGFI